MARGKGRTIIIHHPEGYYAIRRRVESTGDAVAGAVASDARDGAPVKLGNLVSSIRVVKIGVMTWHIQVGTDHWHYMEYGVKPHGPILPVKKQALWWPGLPHPIARVNIHPGNEPRPFMRPATYKTRAVVFSLGGIAMVTG